MYACVWRDRKPRLLDNNWVDRHAMFLSEAMRDIVFKPMLEVEMYIT